MHQIIVVLVSADDAEDAKSAAELILSEHEAFGYDYFDLDVEEHWGVRPGPIPGEGLELCKRIYNQITEERKGLLEKIKDELNKNKIDELAEDWQFLFDLADASGYMTWSRRIFAEATPITTWRDLELELDEYKFNWAVPVDVHF